MKTLPAALDAHLATGATTLCWCWRLTRRDGIRFGFTDHDRDVVFDGTTFEGGGGFTASEIKDAVGLGVDNLEVTSAITSERLAEPDLAAGIYDDARVEIFRVNWQDAAQRVLVRTGSLGEVKRAGRGFAAEVRGSRITSSRPRGGCSSSRATPTSATRAAGSIWRRCPSAGRELSSRSPTRAGSRRTGSARSPRVGSRGALTFTSGAAAGQKIEVKQHTSAAGVVAFELWLPAREPLVAGQAFTITANATSTSTPARRSSPTS